MMTKEQWEAMSPEQQSDAWFNELAGLLQDAAIGLTYVRNNEDTKVLNGNTVIIARSDETQ